MRTERLHHPHLQLLEASSERKLSGFCSPGHRSFGRKTEKVDQIHQMSRCYKDSGVNLETNTMTNWMMRAIEIRLNILYEELLKVLTGSSLLHADETPFEVIRDGRSLSYNYCQICCRWLKISILRKRELKYQKVHSKRSSSQGPRRRQHLQGTPVQSEPGGISPVLLDRWESPHGQQYCRTRHTSLHLGRKNWVNVDSIRGAEVSAIMYSLVETAKANGLRVYEYLEYVLTELTAHQDDTSHDFLADLLSIVAQ